MPFIEILIFPSYRTRLSFMNSSKVTTGSLTSKYCSLNNKENINYQIHPVNSNLVLTLRVQVLSNEKEWKDRILRFDGRYLTYLSKSKFKHEKNFQMETSTQNCYYSAHGIVPMITSPMLSVPSNEFELLTAKPGSTINSDYYQLPEETIDFLDVSHISVLSGFHWSTRKYSQRYPYASKIALSKCKKVFMIHMNGDSFLTIRAKDQNDFNHMLFIFTFALNFLHHSNTEKNSEVNTTQIQSELVVEKPKEDIIVGAEIHDDRRFDQLSMISSSSRKIHLKNPQRSNSTKKTNRSSSSEETSSQNILSHINNSDQKSLLCNKNCKRPSSLSFKRLKHVEIYGNREEAEDLLNLDSQLTITPLMVASIRGYCNKDDEERRKSAEDSTVFSNQNAEEKYLENDSCRHAKIVSPTKDGAHQRSFCAEIISDLLC